MCVKVCNLRQLNLYKDYVIVSKQMYAQAKPSDNCKVCSKPVTHTYHTSELSGEQVCVSICPDKHMTQTVLENREVCPYCQSPSERSCRCIQQTKHCANNHSWLRCSVCSHVTKSEKETHIVHCEKCHPAASPLQKSVSAETITEQPKKAPNRFTRFLMRVFCSKKTVIV